MSTALLRALTAGGAGLAIWLLTLALVRLNGAQRYNRIRVLLTYTLDTRMEATLKAEDVLAAQVAATPFLRRTLKPVWKRVSRIALKYAPTRIIATLQREIDGAGNPHNLAPHELLLIKLLTTGLGLGSGVATVGIVFDGAGVLRMGLYIAAAAIGGFMLPDLWIYRKRRRHLEGIAHVLPDVVDLLRVSMEGGLGYDGAVSYVVAKTKSPLTHELQRYLIDRQLGRGTMDAMRTLGNRTRQPDLLNLAEVVSQGEALGTSISAALNAFSTDLRVKRRQRAEKKAHEATMKMLFPMILLIFPAIFIIILGPTVPIFIQSFGL